MAKELVSIRSSEARGQAGFEARFHKDALAKHLQEKITEFERLKHKKTAANASSIALGSSAVLASAIHLALGTGTLALALSQRKRARTLAEKMHENMGLFPARIHNSSNFFGRNYPNRHRDWKEFEKAIRSLPSGTQLYVGIVGKELVISNKPPHWRFFTNFGQVRVS
ncbi:MAG: hypothetical protein ABH863_04260 [Candidatus Micrarchaeota archaeon]